MDKINLINNDCMNVIPEYETNYFDLAIVDPPYGLPEFSENPEQGTGVLKNRIFQEMDKSKWDKAPDALYFKELLRVSKNQIIWGGNYFNLPPTREIICWDKEQPFPNFSAWEFAWTSFNRPAKIFRMNNRIKNKIHPTEKPVKLYKWLLKQYAKSGQLILDTHLGSGNIAIACHDYNCNFLGIEINSAYYKKASKNYKDHKNQGNLFETRM